MDKLKESISKFNNLWKQYTKYGTNDSEPRWVKNKVFQQAFDLKYPKFPETANDWEIYSSVKGAEEAAKNLTKALKEVVNNLLALPVRDFIHVKQNTYKFLGE